MRLLITLTFLILVSSCGTNKLRLVNKRSVHKKEVVQEKEEAFIRQSDHEITPPNEVIAVEQSISLKNKSSKNSEGTDLYNDFEREPITFVNVKDESDTEHNEAIIIQSNTIRTGPQSKNAWIIIIAILLIALGLGVLFGGALTVGLGYLEGIFPIVIGIGLLTLGIMLLRYDPSKEQEQEKRTREND